jgi:hypothetical protein
MALLHHQRGTHRQQKLMTSRMSSLIVTLVAIVAPVALLFVDITILPMAMAANVTSSSTATVHHSSTGSNICLAVGNTCDGTIDCCPGSVCDGAQYRCVDTSSSGILSSTLTSTSYDLHVECVTHDSLLVFGVGIVIIIAVAAFIFLIAIIVVCMCIKRRRDRSYVTRQLFNRPSVAV